MPDNNSFLLGSLGRAIDVPEQLQSKINRKGWGIYIDENGNTPDFVYMDNFNKEELFTAFVNENIRYKLSICWVGDRVDSSFLYSITSFKDDPKKIDIIKAYKNAMFFYGKERNG